MTEQTRILRDMAAFDADEAKVWRRALAKQAFNRTWDLIVVEGRTPDDDRQMLLTAASSRFLWEEVGGEEERAIGEWQVAHVLSLLGDGSPALLFASEALRRAENNGWDDWLWASSLEGMSRAYAALGQADERDRYAALCREVLASLNDAQDREIVGAQLASIEGVTTTDPAPPTE